MKGRMLVHKYSTFRRTLYAAAGATVYLVEYMGTVAIVQDENGNRFSALNTEVFFGEGKINIDQSVPLETLASAGYKKKPVRKVAAEQTPMLFNI